MALRKEAGHVKKGESWSPLAEKLIDIDLDYQE